MKKSYFLSAVLFVLSAVVFAQPKGLLNKDLKGWTPVMQKNGNSDPQKVFTITPDGMLHVSGAENGYLAFDQPVNDFHLFFEFKWGEAQVKPGSPKNSGVLYYIEPGKDKVWPNCIEYQMQEKGLGNMMLSPGISGEHLGQKCQSPNEKMFILKNEMAIPDARQDWVRVDIISKNGHVSHLVNGKVATKLDNCSRRSGRIAIQSEGSEFFVRNLSLIDFSKKPN